MTSSPSLRELQAPLKSQYKSDPSTAFVTLKSSGTLDDTSITCKLSNSSAISSAHKIAGLHPKAGGPNPDISGELCSGDMLLDALVACAGVTLKAVATALQIPLLGGTVTAEGDMDFRGTLGVDKTAPVGITNIRLGFQLEFGKDKEGKDVTEEQLESLGKLTERYCVVLQTIAKKPEISVRMSGKGKPDPEDDGVERELVWGRRM